MENTTGAGIKKLRKLHYFTQKQVVQFLGFALSQAAELEIDCLKLKSSSLNRLCDLYGCPKEYITEGKGQYSGKNVRFH